MSDKINHELAHALAEFTTCVVDRFDTNDPSAKNQIPVKGVFSGSSCRSLVEYAKEQRELAYKYISFAETVRIMERSQEGKGGNV